MAKRLHIQKYPARGMGLTYKIRLAFGEIAKVLLSRHCEHVFQIDWVHVPPTFRGKGVSNLLMQRVLEDADLFNIELRLIARACGTLTQESLEKWYASFGFQKYGKDTKFGGTKMKRLRTARNKL